MKVVGFFSAKGGVGKTTMAANTATVLREKLMKKVLIIDTHLLGADLSTHFGIVAPLYTLGDVLRGKISVKKAIIRDPKTNVDLIAGPWKDIAKEHLFSKLPSLIKGIRGYEYIILDTPPWLGREISGIIKAVTEAYVVTTPAATAVIEAKRTAEQIERRGGKIRGIVVNMYREGIEYYMTPAEIEEYVEKPVAAVIPYDELVQRAAGYGMPVVHAFPDTDAAIAMKKLAYKMEGIKDIEEESKGFLSRILSLLPWRKRKFK